jgi:predicted lipid-binding transport protein (Tim44 family)
VLEIALFAVLAVVVLYQLYSVLGRRVGRQPDQMLKPKAANLKAATEVRPALEGPAAKPAGLEGAAAITARDAAFDGDTFLKNAGEIYETIVKAFAAGDRDALVPLLTHSVMDNFEAAMAAREAENRTEKVEFLHPPRVDWERGEVVGDTAKVVIRYLAEIRTRSKSAAGEAVDDRRTAELWTFERPLAGADPHWMLSRVSLAQA